MAGSLSLGPLLAQTSIALDPAALEAIDGLVGGVLVAADVQIAANAAVVAGCIGLLLRKKWGWYIVCILHLAQVVVAYVLGLPLVQSAVAIVSPEHARGYGLLITVLISLIPMSVVAFLMLRPVARQFERPAEAQAQADQSFR